MDRAGRTAGVIAGLAALAGVGLLGLAALRWASGEEAGGAPPATAAPEATTGTSATTRPAADDGGYVVVTDETGRISAAVPEAWSDVSGSSWVTSNMEVGPSVSASPDIERWVEEWDTPGVFIGVDEVTSRTVARLLDEADFGGVCTRLSREPFSHDGHVGEVERYTDCGTAGSTFVQVAAQGRGYLVFLQLVVLDPSQADTVLTGWSVSPS